MSFKMHIITLITHSQLLSLVQSVLGPNSLKLI